MEAPAYIFLIDINILGINFFSLFPNTYIKIIYKDLTLHSKICYVQLIFSLKVSSLSFHKLI